MPGRRGSTTAGARRTSTTTQGPLRPGRLRSGDMHTSESMSLPSDIPGIPRSRTTPPRVWAMGEIHVHEFMSLDGVIDAPVWTAEYGFDPAMGDVIGSVTSRASGILFGRTPYQMFEPAWSSPATEDDPGAPFFNDS